MDSATLWWIAGAVLVGAELLTGTFYLLMLASGMAAAALASYAGASLAWQFVVAALVSMLAVAVWHRYRMHRQPPKSTPKNANATSNKLDIGGIVMVDAWQADGTASVHYRGAVWAAIPADASQPQQTGRHQVVDIRSNQLVLQLAP